MGSGTELGIAMVLGERTELTTKRVLVFVAEGYVASRQAQFCKDVEEALDAVFVAMPALRTEVCAVRIDVASREAGADSEAFGDADTYFDAKLGGKDLHLLTVDEPRVIQVVDAQLGGLASSAHAWKTIVLVDFGIASGSGGTQYAMAVAANSGHAKVLAHELGHTLGLGDEYPGSPTLVGAPNVSRSPMRAALPRIWQECLSPPDVELPTPESASGVVIGAYRFEGDEDSVRYRPGRACVMQTVTAAPCKVCDAEVTRVVRGLVRRRPRARPPGRRPRGKTTNSDQLEEENEA